MNFFLLDERYFGKKFFAEYKLNDCFNISTESKITKLNWLQFGKKFWQIFVVQKFPINAKQNINSNKYSKS